MPEILTTEAAEQIIRRLRSGNTFVYHRGYLPIDRERNQSLDRLASFMLIQGSPENFATSELTMVAGLNRGKLTQRRHGPHDYDYRFTKN